MHALIPSTFRSKLRAMLGENWSTALNTGFRVPDRASISLRALAYARSRASSHSTDRISRPPYPCGVKRGASAARGRRTRSAKQNSGRSGRGIEGKSKLHSKAHAMTCQLAVNLPHSGSVVTHRNEAVPTYRSTRPLTRGEFDLDSGDEAARQ